MAGKSGLRTKKKGDSAAGGGVAWMMVMEQGAVAVSKESLESRETETGNRMQLLST